jgi:hypothetical protein
MSNDPKLFWRQKRPHTILFYPLHKTESATKIPYPAFKKVRIQITIRPVVAASGLIFCFVSVSLESVFLTIAKLLMDDETPFELASIAIFKMLNEWEAKGNYISFIIL